MYLLEEQICEAFSEYAQTHSWVVYPETGSWDMLLVKGDIQIGIQAKLKLNIKVIHQALPHDYRRTAGINLSVPGPNYRAVLVPQRDYDFMDVCAACHLACFCPEVDRYGDARWLDQGLIAESEFGKEYLWTPSKPVWLPEHVPTMAAGVPSPRSMSKWKEGALKAMAHLEIHGHITSKDFASYGVSASTFVQRDWIRSSGCKEGRHTLYLRGSKAHQLLGKNPGEYKKYLEVMAGKIPVNAEPQLEL